MSFLHTLFKKLPGAGRKTDRSAEAGQTVLRNELGDGFYLEHGWRSNGMGGYRNVNVYLLRTDDPAFRRCIVDDRGRIQSFPGFAEGDWKQALQFPLDSQVRFVFDIFGYRDGKALVSWVLQPDGKYFADSDGFGAENCEEITLYSHIDTDGRFTEPFAHR